VRKRAGAREGGASSPAVETAGDSITVAAWTLVSRVTGVAKVVAIGAVLGPTFLGNTFQLANAVPNIVYYGLLAGSLFTSLLVPALVGHIDAGDNEASQRVARGFFGIAVLCLAALTPVAVWGAPLLLRVASLGSQDAVGAQQERIGRWLIVMFVPQVFCYAVVGTASAIMNARRRFALAAAAPALENLGMIVVLVLAAALYGKDVTLDNIPIGELLLLGLGTTGAVLLHASVQWWGAMRAGIVLVPRSGWRDPEVRAIVRRALPSLAQAALLAVQVLTLLTLANRVPGGVVAFQIALNFYYLVIALGVTPTALAVLPRLARAYQAGASALFRDTLLRGYAFALFLTIPAAAGLVVLAGPLGEAIAVGRMGSVGGAMVGAALIALAPAVVAQTVFGISSYACYARKDSRSPLMATLVQAALCLTLVSVALPLRGPTVLFALGLACSTAIAASAGVLSRSAGRWGRGGTERLMPSVFRIAAGAALMSGPTWLTARVVPSAEVAVVAAAAVGFTVFVLLAAMWRAPELSSMIGGLARLGTKLGGR
jgi:putative peptidoglycan lipid II flippase